MFLPCVWLFISIKNLDALSTTNYKDHMRLRVYLSEVTPWWTIERQQEALGDALKGATTFTDLLDHKQRRAHRAESLASRATMLRHSTRPIKGQQFLVASYAVLGWEWRDVATVVAAIKERGGILSSVDEAGQPCTEKTWQAARTKSRLEGASIRGAAVSAARRKVRADAGIERIRGDWGKSREEFSTKTLLALAGEPGPPLSYNTVVARLGGREKAQARFQASLKRKMTRPPETR